MLTKRQRGGESNMLIQTGVTYDVQGYQFTWTGCARMAADGEEFLMVDGDGVEVAIPLSVMETATVVR